MQQDNRKKIIFLGTPQVACAVLNALMDKACFYSKVVLVVSQPPARSSRSRELIPSSVQQLAHERGVPVLTPLTAKDPQFLSDLEALKPDLCVTAAYGNYLPERFLKIPKYGTVNIHPSLLPLYRGASPVQRTIENGDDHTGVSILYSVREMDAGPLLAQEFVTLNSDIKTPELLDQLFKLGAQLLVKNLPLIFSRNHVGKEQLSEKITVAKKLAVEESWLDFQLPARRLHNKIRAFAVWPGTKCLFLLDGVPLECKIVTTQVIENDKNLKPGEISFMADAIDISCGDGLVLRVLELQPAGKKEMSARDFLNGVKNKQLKISYG